MYRVVLPSLSSLTHLLLT
ncbi:unnamed protein product [Spirodela intermedia]|uniref:Uncharacterized protein n=1 Tax=Spirodela intermedia TaxID=51605 RepID=A0A7I8K917_SPIIN|nr:unnamed protein product [Spirodela intermedia]